MSRILCAWELGENYGHMCDFLPLALTLRERGHEIIFALKDLSRAQVILGRYRFPLLQAPVWLPVLAGFPMTPPLNYAEILHRVGFLDETGLNGMVKAWRQLYELVQPELLIINSGPTALLAASDTEIPRIMINHGFFSPPRVSPTPNMRPWLNIPQQRLIDSEQKVLAVANSVLADLDASPLNTLSDLFNVEEDFLCTFPELDHYPNRGKARYWGPVFDFQGGVNPQWPSDHEKKVFAYLHPRFRDFEKILQQLLTLPSQCLIHAPGIPEYLIVKYQAVNLKFSPHPLNMRQVREQCDIAICHASHGTTAAMLLAGIPMLLLPMQLEQYLIGRSVASYGAALLADPEITDHDYGEMLEQLLFCSTFADGAKSFSDKYADFSQFKQIESMVKRCEEILGQE